MVKKVAKPRSKKNTEESMIPEVTEEKKPEPPKEIGEAAPKEKNTTSAARPKRSVNPVADETDESKDESSKENGDAAPKAKKTKDAAKEKSTKKHVNPVADETDESKDESSKENGDAAPKAKKTKDAAKKKSTKKPKIVVPGERKSSRPQKPVIKLGVENEAYEVENIVGMRVECNVTQYLVRWKGYSRGDDTWEDESSLTNCPEMVNKFKAERPPTEEKGQKRKSSSKSPVRPKKQGKTQKKKLIR